MLFFVGRERDQSWGGYCGDGRMVTPDQAYLVDMGALVWVCPD